MKASAIIESSMQITAKGGGKSEAKLQPMDANVGASLFEGRAFSIQELYKAFCIRFVRLNGILFTRTGLETFAEVLSLVCCSLNELLSPGPEEELNFGTDAVENGLVIVRLVSILIFTVHYVNREGESQSYADIVQRTVLLHNALAAVYELVGSLLKKCIQLHDPCSSYLLPGILVFVEWLACSPDVATCNDKDGKQATVRSVFWNHFLAFLNKLLSSGLVVMDDDDETCFFNMSRYEEGGTENRLALWEDFELRGFLPLQPAQTVLEFSRKLVRGDGNKEKIVRVKRILAAGKALANVVTIDQKNMIFDLKEKIFVIGVNSQTSEDFMLTPYLGSPKLNDISPQLPTQITKSAVIEQPKAFVEGEEEDEVIVFKPTVTEKRSDFTVSKWVPPEALEPGKNAIASNSHFPGGSASGSHRDLHQQMVYDATSQSPVSVASHVLPHLQSVHSHSSMWLDQHGPLANGLSGLCILENGHVVKPGMQEDLPISHNTSFSLPTRQSASVNASGTSYSQEKASEMMMQSKINPIASSGVTSGSLAVNMSSTLPVSSKKGPVNRPVRHLGPPPGFSSVLPRQANGPVSGSDLVADNLLPDDYSWLDGYALPLTTKGSRPNQLTNHPLHSNPNHISKHDGFVGTTSFPFPGKQVLPKQFPVEKQNGWEDNHTLEHLNLQQQKLHLQLQQPMKGDQEFIPLPEQHQGKSLWGGRYPV